MDKTADDILRMFETIPRETRNKDTEKTCEKDSADERLKSSETITRQAKVTKEGAAVADIKELVQYLEKMVDGTLQDSDKQNIRKKTAEYQKSIGILVGMLLMRS